MTGGGADYCFECVGLASLVHEAYACCRKVSLYFSPQYRHKDAHKTDSGASLICLLKCVFDIVMNAQSGEVD